MKVLMRFVDWYADNGQNYQHNASLVEKQLEQLAHRSTQNLQGVAFTQRNGGRGSFNKPAW